MNNGGKFLETKEFFKLIDLDWDNIILEQDGGLANLNHEFEITPEEFIKFAEKDIEENDKRGLINALSNSKRAIDCQIDKALYCFGIDAKKWKLWNFPKKLEFIQDLGFLAPRIIGKVIKIRNLLEHEYKFPEKNEVEDAIDIAMLFLDVTNRSLQLFCDSFILGDAKNMYTDDHRFNHCIYFTFDYSLKKFELRGYKSDKRCETNIDPSDKEKYMVALKLGFYAEKLLFNETVEIDDDIFQPFK